MLLHPPFVQDCYGGADPTYRLPIRIITENAWHSLFARNMFILPSTEGYASFKPEWTVIQAPDFHSIPETDGTNSEVCVMVNIPRKTVLVAGSHYTDPAPAHGFDPVHQEPER